ncbi:MAG: hypothetical protein ACRDLO_09070, partial [Solirubrobacterales bacterium]
MRVTGKLLMIAATMLAGLALWAPASGAAAPELGATAGEVDLRSVPGTEAYGEGHAIPLEAARPDWYTRKLRRKVRLADGEPVQAPPDAPLPSEVG